MVALQAGCILPFTHEPRPRPDPLQSQAVRIAAVSGRTVTLSDGRTFEVACLDDRELTVTQRMELERMLRGQPYFFVLADDLGNGKARLIELQAYLEHPWFESLAIRVCVIHDDVYPQRRDLGLLAVEAGLADVRPEELAQANDLPPTPAGKQFAEPRCRRRGTVSCRQ